MILGISGGVFAYGKHNHWGFSPEEKAEFVSERITKKLDLNDTQQQNLQVLVTDALALMEEMGEDKEAHKAEIQSLLAEPEFDQNKALQMVQAKTQKINDRAPAAIASLALFLDSLDMEQKTKVQSFIDKGMHHGRRYSEHNYE